MTTRTRSTTTRLDPDRPSRAVDHGANDGPAVGAAPTEAVRGGLAKVARGVGSGLAAGADAVRRIASAVDTGGRPRGPRRP